MNLDDKVKALKEHQKKLKAYNHAASLLFYDASTSMPAGAAESMSATTGVLNGKYFTLCSTPQSVLALFPQTEYQQRGIHHLQTGICSQNDSPVSD